MSTYYKHKECYYKDCKNPAYYTTDAAVGNVFCPTHIRSVIKVLLDANCHEVIADARPLDPEEYLIECHVPPELENQIIELNQQTK